MGFEVFTATASRGAVRLYVSIGVCAAAGLAGVVRSMWPKMKGRRLAKLQPTVPLVSMSIFSLRSVAFRL